MTARRDIRAVLFDFDGVLVQSMERHAEAYRQVLAPLGITGVTDLDVFRLEGKKSTEVLALLAKNRGRADLLSRIDELGEEKNKRYRAMGVPPFYPGAERLVRRLKREGYRVAVVTGTSRKNFEHIVGDLAPEFDAVVTADDVRRTKPNPEPYLSAARALQVSPRDCLVVENAILGIQAGLAAGARVVAVPTTLPPEDLWEANAILHNLEDVLHVLNLEPHPGARAP